eukprot:superscaffoldBa00000926_g8037
MGAEVGGACITGAMDPLAAGDGAEDPLAGGSDAVDPLTAGDGVEDPLAGGGDVVDPLVGGTNVTPDPLAGGGDVKASRSLSSPVVCSAKASEPRRPTRSCDLAEEGLVAGGSSSIVPPHSSLRVARVLGFVGLITQGTGQITEASSGDEVEYQTCNVLICERCSADRKTLNVEEYEEVINILAAITERAGAGERVHIKRDPPLVATEVHNFSSCVQEEEREEDSGDTIKESWGRQLVIKYMNKPSKTTGFQSLLKFWQKMSVGLVPVAKRLLAILATSTPSEGSQELGDFIFILHCCFVFFNGEEDSQGGGEVRIKAAVQQLEDSIENIKSTISSNPDFAADTLLQEKRLELSTFMQARVKGVLIRSRSLNVKDMDALSSFFFSLEKTVARSRLIISLRLPGGRVTTDPKEIRRYAVIFYSFLFGANKCDPDSAAELLEGHPQFSPEEKADLDRGISLEELTAAVGQMASDDLNVFVRDQRDMDALQISLGLYQKASSAKVNWVKSEALQVGQWRERAAPSLPADAARLILLAAGHLRYSKQLFLLRQEEADLTGLPSFYTSVLDAWKIPKATRDLAAMGGLWLFEEPLFFNSFIQTQTLSSASLRSSLRHAGCVKL